MLTAPPARAQRPRRRARGRDPHVLPAASRTGRSGTAPRRDRPPAPSSSPRSARRWASTAPFPCSTPPGSAVSSAATGARASPPAARCAACSPRRGPQTVQLVGISLVLSYLAGIADRRGAGGARRAARHRALHRERHALRAARLLARAHAGHVLHLPPSRAPRLRLRGLRRRFSHRVGTSRRPPSPFRASARPR